MFRGLVFISYLSVCALALFGCSNAEITDQRSAETLSEGSSKESLDAEGSEVGGSEKGKSTVSKNSTNEATDKAQTNPKPSASEDPSPDTTEESTPVVDPWEKIAITFTGVKGDTVPGYLWQPKAPGTTKYPAVLLMYGINGNKDSGGTGLAAQELNKRGVVAITMDWIGAKGGDRGSIPNSQRITDKNFMTQTVGDYGKAIDFLATKPFVDQQKIAFMGVSMGAMTGIVFAAQDQRIKTMTAIVPLGNLLWGSDAPEIRVRQIPARPIHCIYATGDGQLSKSVCDNAAGSNSKIEVFEGAHDQVGNEALIAQSAFDFFAEHLLK